MPNLLTKQAEVQTLGSVVTVARPRLLRLDLVAANVRESSVQPLTPPGSRMQAALQGLESGHYNDHRLGTRPPRQEADSKKQILTPGEEDIVVDWCNVAASSAKPVHYSQLRAQDQVTSRPQGLDPKRAKNFNRATIGKFFEMRKQLEFQHDGIPPDHHWNMDERGCQMGSGRGNLRMSDNLVPVTTIECVNATGAKMPPWFVLTTGQVPDIRDLEDKVGQIVTQQLLADVRRPKRLAGALGISAVDKSKTRIKDYLVDPSHADIVHNPRFSALFQAAGKTCVPPVTLKTHSQVLALTWVLSSDDMDSRSLWHQAMR
ncbi:hypothetical protein DFH94DRAFT_806413 [Russula ochroleuca]|uniref:Uncharacterized protein n=1 Tax=Russula ochroleuca TaxID=152965 RepID=A0A9P5MNI1_9AGAM|nr:hypothetical protein DFH94DRAFT_806413 [Russula ochroleuca]